MSRLPPVKSHLTCIFTSCRVPFRTKISVPFICISWLKTSWFGVGIGQRPCLSIDRTILTAFAPFSVVLSSFFIFTAFQTESLTLISAQKAIPSGGTLYPSAVLPSKPGWYAEAFWYSPELTASSPLCVGYIYTLLTTGQT